MPIPARETSDTYPPILLNYRQVADLLSMNILSLRNRVSDGSFPVRPVKIGRSVRFPADQIYKLAGGGK